MKPFFIWLRSVFSESGPGSYTRLCGYTVVVVALALICATTWSNAKDPEHKIDIPPAAQTVLMALIGAAVVGYGTNKIMASRSGKVEDLIPGQAVVPGAFVTQLANLADPVIPAPPSGNAS